jgi:DNA polymerase I-like protein with 3'-5' exonuclease and polymerase domains
MERNGVLIDRDQLAAQSHQLGTQMLQLESQHELAGQPFNLNSPKQLQEILFGKLGIPTKGIKKTRPVVSPPTNRYWKRWRWITRCPSASCNTAA